MKDRFVGYSVSLVMVIELTTEKEESLYHCEPVGTICFSDHEYGGEDQLASEITRYHTCIHFLWGYVKDRVDYCQ